LVDTIEAGRDVVVNADVVVVVDVVLLLKIILWRGGMAADKKEWLRAKNTNNKK
jgi:hypothetical protein